MPRLLPSLCALAITCGIAGAITAALGAAPDRSMEIVGREQPVFLGSTVVTASVLAVSR